MQRTRRLSRMVKLLSIVVPAVLTIGATSRFGAAMEEQKVPSAAAPQGQTAQPPVAPASAQGDDWERVPTDGGSAPATPGPEKLPAMQDTPASLATATATPSATPTPEPPPALDVSSIDTGGDIAMKPLDAEIKTAVTPSMAASLRVAEQARRQLAKGSVDPALRNLTQAVSIDPGDPFAYYFLGRAHFERKNYQQALTFLKRAQLGFSKKPDWLGETLSYEGACEEALGDQLKAAKAYQHAVAVAPANFRARIGYGRLSAILAPTPSADLPPLSSDGAPPAPSAPIDEPPPAEVSAPPAQ